MDTKTVLQIIKMLDNQISIHWEDARNSCQYDTPSRDELPDYQCELGKAFGLESFRDHLQSYIEGQFNAAENETVE